MPLRKFMAWLRPSSEHFAIASSSECDALDESPLENDVVMPSGIQDYPLVPTGIPVKPVEDILRIHSKILHLTFEECGLDEYSEFEKLYLNIVRNFIKFAHLVPASENNHHIRAGGLVEHSLEVAFYSMRNAGLSILPQVGYCDYETMNRQPRYRYAAWLTGLLHDAGKPYTDFTVIGQNGKAWPPLVKPLFTWCIDEGISSYHCVWHAGRTHKEHDHITLSAAQMILTDYVKQYISASTDNLWKQIAISLSSYNKREGYIESSVRQADYLSTEQDAKRFIDKMMGDRAAPIQTHLIMAMRSLRQRWTANKPNSQIWIINDNVYLLWPVCIEAMITLAQERDHKVPSDPNVALHILESRGYIDKPEDGSSFMLFSPAQMATGKLKVIRLSSPGHLYEGEPIPGNVPGTIRLATDTSPSPNVIAHEDSLPRTSTWSECGEIENIGSTPESDKDAGQAATGQMEKLAVSDPSGKSSNTSKLKGKNKGKKGNKSETLGIVFTDVQGERPDSIVFDYQANDTPPNKVGPASCEASALNEETEENEGPGNSMPFKELDIGESVIRAIIYSLSNGDVSIGIRSAVFVHDQMIALKWPSELVRDMIPPKGCPTEMVQHGYIVPSEKEPTHRKTFARKRTTFLLFTREQSIRICRASGLDPIIVLAKRSNKTKSKTQNRTNKTEPQPQTRSQTLSAERYQASYNQKSEELRPFLSTVWEICNNSSLEGVIYEWRDENSVIAIDIKMLFEHLKGLGCYVAPDIRNRFILMSQGKTKLNGKMAVLLPLGVFRGS